MVGGEYISMRGCVFVFSICVLVCVCMCVYESYAGTVFESLFV